MTQLRVQIAVGLVLTATCLAIGLPTLIVHFEGGRLPAIPTAAWATLFLGFAAAFSATLWLMESTSRGVLLTTLSIQATLGPVLVLTAPAAGWTPILLVFTVALSGYLVPLGHSALLGLANTAVVALASWLNSASAVEIALSALLYLMLQAASVLGVHLQLRENESRKRLAEAHVKLRAATTLLEESSRSEERLHIARELHDLVGHQLTVLALELEIASHQAEGASADSVGRARELTRTLLRDVRATLSEFRRNEPRLADMLERLIADLPEPKIHLTLDGALTLDEERSHALLRCVQEVVTNAIRHSKAENLWIAVGAEDDRVLVDARDDGVGVRELIPGQGLSGMSERLAAVGGTVRFSGEHGFRVRAEVPAS